MAEVYKRHIAQIKQREFATAGVKTYFPRYQWFVGAALLLLLIELLISPYRKVKPTDDFLSEDTETLEEETSHETTSMRSQITGSVKQVLIVLAILGAAGSSSAASEPTPKQIIHDANQSLKNGDVDGAIKIYEQIKVDSRDLPELRYNQGVAQYRKGNYTKASDLFSEVLVTKNKNLEAKARFNIGNCNYAEALGLLKKDKKTGIEKLKTAITHYRESLQANPNNTDARANIELANLLMKEEKKKHDQQHKQKKQDKQKQDQDKNKQQQKQKQKQQDKQKQDQDKNKQQQKQEQKQQDNQKQDQDKNKQQQKQEQKQQDKPQKGNGGADSSDAKLKPVQKDKLSPEEAAKLLQAVRDKNLKRRIEKYRRQKVREIPTDRDW